MTLTLPAADNYLALLVGPDTREDLRTKNAAQSQVIHELRAALAASEMRERAATRDLATAEQVIDAITVAWAKTIRPSTAERRARVWLGKGGKYGAGIAVRFVERASA